MLYMKIYAFKLQQCLHSLSNKGVKLTNRIHMVFSNHRTQLNQKVTICRKLNNLQVSIKQRKATGTKIYALNYSVNLFLPFFNN